MSNSGDFIRIVNQLEDLGYDVSEFDSEDSRTRDTVDWEILADTLIELVPDIKSKKISTFTDMANQ